RCRMMGEIGPESISSMEGSPARTSALQEMEQAWKEREVDLFTKYSDYPDRSAPPSYSWKMSQQLQPEVVWHWSKKLPRWGMTVDGVLYPLLPLERYTKGNDGSCWPTPTARDWKGITPKNRNSQSLPDAIRSEESRVG